MSRLTQILKGKKVKPLTEMENAVKYAVDHSGSGSGLPDVTSADNGDVLGVVGGEWAKTTPKSYAPFETLGTAGTSVDEKDTITLNKTASELFTAVGEGQLCKITATMTVQETTVTNEVITSVSCGKLTDGSGTTTYSFAFVAPDGVKFKVEDLSASDTVVFTAE